MQKSITNTKNAEEFGVIAPEVGFDFLKVQARKEETRIDYLKGRAFNEKRKN